MADGSGPITNPIADFDFKNPDYAAVFMERARRLAWLRQAQADWLKSTDPAKGNMSPVDELKAYYKGDIETRGARTAQFITDWGVTFDPRNADIGLPTVIPFILFPKQVDFIEWVCQQWRDREPGLCDKSRDGGVSWLAMSAACTLALFNDGLSFGFGSRKEEYVDLVGATKTLFYKGRMFLKYLPAEFRAGWDERKHAPFKRILFPATGSEITGEAGDEIGRGDRKTIYFVDEAASLERPALVDASLSATTNCRIDISSAKGMANPFAQKRHSWPSKRLFTLHWRDDPRKDQAWYDKQCDEMDAVTVAQEIDINYSASATGIMIPSAWVQASIDAHERLGFEITGAKRGAMDVADGGPDNNAFATAHGVYLESVEEWAGGKDEAGDIFKSVVKAMGMAERAGMKSFLYDADGMGAGVRGDARVANEARAVAKLPIIRADAFRGSGAVFKPESLIPSASLKRGDPNDAMARKNKDFFMNAKAQAWWDLRVRFQRTFRAINAIKEGQPNPYNPDDLISINGKMPNLAKLLLELSQPTFTESTIGKIVVDKTPEGTRSPNLADAVMIVYAPRKAGFLDYLNS